MTYQSATTKQIVIQQYFFRVVIAILSQFNAFRTYILAPYLIKELKSSRDSSGRADKVHDYVNAFGAGIGSSL